MNIVRTILCMIIMLGYSIVHALPEKERKELETIEQTHEAHWACPEKLENMRKVLNRIASKDHLDYDSRARVIQTRNSVKLLLPAARIIKTYNIHADALQDSTCSTLLSKLQRIELSSLPTAAKQELFKIKQELLIIQHDFDTRMLLKQAAHASTTTETIKPYINFLTAYETDPAGNTALHLACSHGNAHALSAFMELQAQLDASAPKVDDNLPRLAHIKNNKGLTPLLCAAAHGTSQTVRTLLAWSDIDHTARDADNNNALWIAIKHENYDVIPELITAGFDPRATYKHSKTALHYAARAKNVRLCPLFLPHIGINTHDARGNTPLDILLAKHTFTTSDKQLIEILKLFKQHGAQLHNHVDDKRAQLALKLKLDIKQQPSKPQGQQRVVVIPRKKRVSKTPQELFTQYVKSSNIKQLTTLLDNHDEQIDINYEDKQTPHPLIAAIVHDNALMIRNLLRHGCNENIKSRHGSYYPEVAIGNQQNLDLRGAPPLFFAYALRKDDAFMELLYNEVVDIDINATNDQGETILDFIIKDPHVGCTHRDQKDCLRIRRAVDLIRRGADICNGQPIFKDKYERKLILSALADNFLTVNITPEEGISFEDATQYTE